MTILNALNKLTSWWERKKNLWNFGTLGFVHKNILGRTISGAVYHKFLSHMQRTAVVIHNGILWKSSLHFENCVNLKLGLYWIYVEVLLFVFFFLWRLILPVAKHLDHLFVFLLFQFFRKGLRNSYLFQVILIFRKMQNFFIIPQRNLSHSLHSENLSLSSAKIIGPLFLFIFTRCRTMFTHRIFCL